MLFKCPEVREQPENHQRKGNSAVKTEMSPSNPSLQSELDTFISPNPDKFHNLVFESQQIKNTRYRWKWSVLKTGGLARIIENTTKPFILRVQVR